MKKIVITLTTDFGAADPFVGIMKGVILSINPDAVIVDICHEIEPGNVPRAAYVLDSAIDFFPSDTIHVVVVDPGVGSSQRRILMKSGDALFLAPDNGLLTLAAKKKGTDIFLEISNPDYFIRPVSATFHGRDIFAPVAGHLSLGKGVYELGKEINDPVTLDTPEPSALGNGTERGAIIYGDRFGNMTTNLTLPQGEDATGWRLRVVGIEEIPLCSCYAESGEGSLSAVVNSSGRVELFVKNGNAVESHGLKEGDDVILEKR